MLLTGAGGFAFAPAVATGATWTPTAGPAINNEAFGSFDSTFSSLAVNNASTSDVVVICISTSARHITGVTIGGDAMTLAAESSSSTAAASIWYITGEIYTTANVVVSAAAGLQFVGCTVGVLTGVDPTPGPAAVKAFGFNADPQVTTTAATIPDGGFAIVVLASGAGGSDPVWNNGTENYDLNSGSDWRHTSGYDDTPGAFTASISGFSFAGSAIAVVPWAPLDAYTSEAEAIWAEFDTPPSWERRGVINDAVVALMDAGVWSKLDVLYMFAAADSQAAKINWKDPGTFDATAVNSPTFTADAGFTGNGTNSYVDTNFNPVSASGQMAAADAHIMAFLTTTPADVKVFVGFTADYKTFIAPNVGGTNTQYAITDNAQGGINIANAIAATQYTATRTASNACNLYKGGSSINATSTAVTASLTNSNMSICRGPAGDFSSARVSAASAGAALTAGEVSDYYDAMLAYMEAVYPFEPESLAIFDEFTTPPTFERKLAINTCVAALIDAGVWDKLDVLYMFAAADSQAALINWKSPGSFTATAANSPTFTADRGFTGNGSAYLDTGYAPNTEAINLSLNSASLGGYTRNNRTSGATDALGGARGGGAEPFLGLQAKNASDKLAGAANTAGGFTLSTSTVGSAQGSSVVSRTASNLTTVYRDGASVGSDATASTAIPPGENIFVLAMSRDAGSAFLLSGDQVSSFFVGGGLTAGEVSDYYDAELAYLQTVGAA